MPSNQQLNFRYYITAYAQIPTEAVFMMRKGKLQIQDVHVGDFTSFWAQLPEWDRERLLRMVNNMT